MKRGLWITVAGLLVFAAIVVARMPASWVLPTGPKAQFTCASIEGSLWSGACGGLVAQQMPLGDLAWELHPLKLLGASLAAHVALTRAAMHASADVELGLGGRLTARNLQAELPLDAQTIPGFPPQIAGNAHVDLALAQFAGGAVKELKGTIEAHDLQDRAGQVTPLGSYRITFPGGEGDPTGQIQDLDGPLSVTGTVRLTAGGGYEIEGLVAARPGASAELVNNMRYLGTPDAAGRRPFSFSGTF